MGKQKKSAFPDSYDPFQARPMIAERVEILEDKQTSMLISKELHSQKGLSGFMAKKFGLKKRIKVNLDEKGVRFWKLIDGKRTLGMIEEELRNEWKLSARESKDAIVQFVKGLMTRGLIYLALPGSRGNVSGKVSHG